MKNPTNADVAWALFFLGLLAPQFTMATPKLAPFTPAGWSGPLVVTTSSTSTTNTPALTSSDSLFLDWCVINNGTTASSPFVVTLYLDGAFFDSWNIGSLPVNNYEYVTAESLGMLSAGPHAVGIIAGSGSTGAAFTNSFTVSDAFLPAPTLLTPSDNSTNQSTSPVLTWSSVSGAASYRLFVAAAILDLPTDPAATNGGLNVAANATTSSPTSTLSTPLLPGTTYYWEAQGNSPSQSGHWSAVGSFTTAFPIGPGLTIIPTFDSSITSDPQAATIEATILSSIAAYRHYFSDNITVTITYEEMSSGLGLNDFSYETISYTSYLAALKSHASSPDDATALANLPDGPGNPVNGNTDINVKFPQARALGFNIRSSPPDDVIYLNTSIMNLSGAQTDPTKYSLYSTVCHETDEALGLGSALDQVKSGSATLSDPIFPEDLFRYDASGARSYTTDVNASSYFSLDGSTLLAQFNQATGGDAGDWYSIDVDVTPQVQDASLAPGVFPMLGVELRALDVVGFTPTSSSILDQTIAFAPLPNKTLGSPPFPLGATASSGLPVSFSILSGPATISSDIVTLTGLGAVVVEASQPGDSTYNPAPNVNQSFNVYPPPSVGVTLSGATFVLSWPTNVSGYVLESTTNLTQPIAWSVVSGTPTVLGNSYVLTGAATSQSKFFRLAQ